MLGCVPHGSRDRPRKSERHEEVIRVEIVFARLIHHPDQPARAGATIWQAHSVFRGRADLVSAGAKVATQQDDKVPKQVGHRARRHDGGAAWPGTLAIDITAQLRAEPLPRARL